MRRRARTCDTYPLPPPPRGRYLDAGRDVIARSDITMAAIALAVSEYDVGWELMLGEPEAETTAARVGRVLAFIKARCCAAVLETYPVCLCFWFL